MNLHRHFLDHQDNHHQDSCRPTTHYYVLFYVLHRKQIRVSFKVLKNGFLL